jgi:hypothetical protein
VSVSTAPAPASNVVVLSNGVAVPQLQPAQTGAPALIEAETSLATTLSANLDRAAAVALEQRANLSAPASNSAVEYQAVKSCGN